MSTGDTVFLGIAVFFISLTVILIIYGIVSHSKRRKAQREQKQDNEKMRVLIKKPIRLSKILMTYSLTLKRV